MRRTHRIADDVRAYTPLQPFSTSTAAARAATAAVNAARWGMGAATPAVVEFAPTPTMRHGAVELAPSNVVELEVCLALLFPRPLPLPLPLPPTAPVVIRTLRAWFVHTDVTAGSAAYVAPCAEARTQHTPRLKEGLEGPSNCTSSAQAVLSLERG